MPLRLVSQDGTKTYDLRVGVPLIVGRAPTCDLPVFDPTISRRHAEITSDGGEVVVRDLGSSNGTFVNGIRTSNALLAVDDTVAFGKVSFKLAAYAAPTPSSSLAGLSRPMAGATIIRQIPMPDPRASAAAARTPARDKSQEKL